MDYLSERCERYSFRMPTLLQIASYFCKVRDTASNVNTFIAIKLDLEVAKASQSILHLCLPVPYLGSNNIRYALASSLEIPMDVSQRRMP